jgi:tetratricopeptide (TPR) repeat protein
MNNVTKIDEEALGDESSEMARSAVETARSSGTLEKKIKTPVPRLRKSAGGEVGRRVRMASILRLSDVLLERAVAAYDRLFNLDTREESEIYLEVGTQLARGGRRDEALEALRTAAEQRPDDGAPWVQIARLYMQKHAYKAALDAFKKAGDRGETGFKFHYKYAEALIAVDDHEGAARELKLAIDARPEAHEALYRMASAQDRLGRHEEAAEALKKALELQPDEIVYHQSLGFTFESMGRRKEAIKCFKAALDLERTKK